MHFTFFDEDIGVNLDNKSTYWKISFSAERQCSTLSIQLLISGASIQLYFSLLETVFNCLIFHLVSRGKKIAHKIYRFSKHVVIFSDYFQVCISWKKKGVVKNLFVSQRLGWIIITEIFHRKVIHKIFPFMVVTFNITLLITLLIKS